MRRITITVDDELVDLARSDVEAGLAPSVSAWVARAMQERALARRELRAELDRMEQESPTTAADVAEMAKVLDQTEDWVWNALGLGVPADRVVVC